MNFSSQPALTSTTLTGYYYIKFSFRCFISQLLDLFHSRRITYKAFKSSRSLFICSVRLLLCPLFHLNGQRISLSGSVFCHFIILHKDIPAVAVTVLFYPNEMAIYHSPVNFVYTFQMSAVLTLHKFFQIMKKNISVQYLIRSHANCRKQFLYLARNILSGKFFTSQEFSSFLSSVSITFGLKKFNNSGESIYCHHVAYTLQIIHIVLFIVKLYTHAAFFKINGRLNTKSKIAVSKLNPAVRNIIAEGFVYRLNLFIVIHSDG